MQSASDALDIPKADGDDTPPPPSSKQTYIDVSAIYANMDKLIDASQYVYNVKPDDIKKIVFKNVIRPAEGFLYRDVIFDTTKPSNGFQVNGDEGTITA